MSVDTLGRLAKRWPRTLILSLATAAVLQAGPAALAVTADNSPKAFLEAIYKNYMGDSATNALGVSLDGNAAVRRYFSAGLAHLMLEDEASAKRKNAVPALDGDAFVGHQEWEIADLAIDVKEKGPTKATGTVSFTNFGKPEKVVIELLNAGEGWRISDIQWPEGTLRALYRKK
jgi:Protein of unknown function (DUF3828)